MYVANMIAQHGIRVVNGVPPIRYDALSACLKLLADWAKTLEIDGKIVSFHGPRMGAGLAGGDWTLIEKIVDEVLGEFNVYIYDL